MKNNNKQCSISFVEKVRIFTHDYLKYCVFISEKDSQTHVSNKKLYSSLISTSQLLEDFLDFHGAKNNKDWYFFRELSAAVRHLSLGCYSQKHILNRLLFYELADWEKFKTEGEATFDFLVKSLIKIAPVIIEEAKRLNIPIPQEKFSDADFPGVITGEMLDYDIDDEDKDQQKKSIVKIASEFIDIAGKFEQFGFYEPYDLKEIFTI
ncbi:MAG: HPr family phosphocarrier protein, partial [Thermodesulfobacteriota bacterium]|nr:HPr family phosphocarrier protein [Thermodesulfobacteriota bacterium]